MWWTPPHTFKLLYRLTDCRKLALASVEFYRVINFTHFLNSSCALCTSSGWIRTMSLLSLKENLSVNKSCCCFSRLYQLQQAAHDAVRFSTSHQYRQLVNYRKFFIWKNTAQWCSCFTDYSLIFLRHYIMGMTAIFNI